MRTAFFEPPLPSLLPPGIAVFADGIRVTNAVHADVSQGTILIYDYDQDGRIMRDAYGVPTLFTCQAARVEIRQDPPQSLIDRYLAA